MFLLPHGHKISKQSFGLAEFLTKKMWLSPWKCHFPTDSMSCCYLLANTNGDRCLLSHEQRTSLAISETSIHLTQFFASALNCLLPWPGLWGRLTDQNLCDVENWNVAGLGLNHPGLSFALNSYLLPTLRCHLGLAWARVSAGQAAGVPGCFSSPLSTSIPGFSGSPFGESLLLKYTLMSPKAFQYQQCGGPCSSLSQEMGVPTLVPASQRIFKYYYDSEGLRGLFSALRKSVQEYYCTHYSRGWANYYFPGCCPEVRVQLSRPFCLIAMLLHKIHPYSTI